MWQDVTSYPENTIPMSKSSPQSNSLIWVLGVSYAHFLRRALLKENLPHRKEDLLEEIGIGQVSPEMYSRKRWVKIIGESMWIFDWLCQVKSDIWIAQNWWRCELKLEKMCITFYNCDGWASPKIFWFSLLVCSMDEYMARTGTGDCCFLSSQKTRRPGPSGCRSPVESLPSGWGLGLLYDHLFRLHILQKGALQPEETCLMDLGDAPFSATRPGKRLQKAMERSTLFFMGKSSISMAIFNSYVSLPEGTQFAVTSMSHRFLGALFRNRLYTCDLRPSPTFAPPFCRDVSWMGTWRLLWVPCWWPNWSIYCRFVAFFCWLNARSFVAIVESSCWLYSCRSCPLYFFFLNTAPYCAQFYHVPPSVGL